MKRIALRKSSLLKYRMTKVRRKIRVVPNYFQSLNHMRNIVRRKIEHLKARSNCRCRERSYAEVSDFAKQGKIRNLMWWQVKYAHPRYLLTDKDKESIRNPKSLATLSFIFRQCQIEPIHFSKAQCGKILNSRIVISLLIQSLRKMALITFDKSLLSLLCRKNNCGDRSNHLHPSCQSLILPPTKISTAPVNRCQGNYRNKPKGVFVVSPQISNCFYGGQHA